MFGLYEIRVPSFLMNIAGGEARSGIAGSLVMGTTMGIIAAPCIGPFIVGLMTYVAKLGDPFKGFLMFFILALGMGIPYLILGIFSSNITSLPRSGEWMIGVRKIFGFILVIMAVYFLDPVLSDKAYTILFSLSFLIGGFWLIVLDRSGEKNRGFHIFKSVIAIVMIILGTWLFRPDTRSAVQIQWQEYSETLLAQAKEKGKPVIIDFFADWCIPCKELDKLTFTNPLVQDYADRFVFLKADLTQEKSEFSKAIKAQYSIKGVPTVVFIKPDGGENASVRLTGFEKAKEFVKRMEKTLGK
jgi:thiol:disulfide interchange protein DsbD